MKAEILFDMDGTIADLYGVENWLQKLRAYDATPYENAKPIYENEILTRIVKNLMNSGYKIKIVTALPKNGGNAFYNQEVKNAKLEWLKKHGFPFHSFHCIPYSENKGNYVSKDAEIAILVDDNKDVRESFLKQEPKTRRTIDANGNILIQLAKLFTGDRP